MDATFLNELLECSVCLEQLDSTSRVLPCQHTFCKRCLQEIVQSKGVLCCPECRTLVDTKVDDLPVNIFLVRLLEGIKNKMPRSKIHLPTNQQMFGADPHLLSSTGVCPGGSSGLGQPGFYAQIGSHPLCCARAIYAYESSNSSDLSFQKGDLINLIKRIDVNWYQGELKGKVGFVPASYITVVTLGSLTPSLAPPGQANIPQGQALAKALYDFQITDKSSEEKECLTFSRGEIICVIRRVDENWAEGRIGDRQGIFPISFVEMNIAAKQLIKMITCSGPSRVVPALPPLRSSLSDQGGGAKTPSQIPDGLLSDPTSASENKRHSLSALNLSTVMGTTLVTPTSSSAPVGNGSTSEHRHSMEILADHRDQAPLAAPGTKLCPLVNGPILSVSTNAGQLTSQHTNKLMELDATIRRQHGVHRAKDDTSQPSLFYVALYNYKPQKDDELELKKGEVYMVSEKCQDGWFKGSALKTGAQGVFPGNYVQLAAGKAAQAPTPFYSPNGPQVSQAGLVQGFSSLCVSSPMRPRSNPQLPLSILYGGTGGPQRSSEWPLSSTAFSSQFADVIVSGPPLTCGTTQVMTGGVGGAMLKCGQTSGLQYRTLATTPSLGKSAGWGQTTEHGGSSPPLPSSGLSTQSSAIIAQHLSLVKRLTRHKSKSPPPALGLPSGGGSFPLESSPPVHIRSGSCPSSHSSPAGPSSGPTSTLHKKTASLDDALASPSQSPLTPLTPLGGGSPPPPPPSQAATTTTPTTTAATGGEQTFRCIVPYPANSDYELELKVGDVVYVHKKRDDGWCKGTLQRTGRTGLFPASFVKQTSATDPIYGDYGLSTQQLPPSLTTLFHCGPGSGLASAGTHILNPPQ